jgi:hypothetical protein
MGKWIAYVCMHIYIDTRERGLGGELPSYLWAHYLLKRVCTIQFRTCVCHIFICVCVCICKYIHAYMHTIHTLAPTHMYTRIHACSHTCSPAWRPWKATSALFRPAPRPQRLPSLRRSSKARGRESDVSFVCCVCPLCLSVCVCVYICVFVCVYVYIT